MKSVRLCPKDNEKLLHGLEITVRTTVATEINEKVLAGWSRKDAVEAIIKEIEENKTSFIVTLVKND